MKVGVAGAATLLGNYSGTPRSFATYFCKTSGVASVRDPSTDLATPLYSCAALANPLASHGNMEIRMRARATYSLQYIAARCIVPRGNGKYIPLGNTGKFQ